MATPILMPALSPTMEEGNLALWHKKEGDSVKSGDILAEIETDKAMMEVEAVDEGILAKIMIPAGTQDVKVGEKIAILTAPGEKLEDLPRPTPVANSKISDKKESFGKEDPSASEKFSSPAHQDQNDLTSARPLAKKDKVIASPLARKLASQNNLNLKTISGSGPRGRIIRRDIETHLAQGLSKETSSQALPIAAITPSDPVFSGNEPPFTETPVSSMRRTIAQRLTFSKQTIPHFYLTAVCQVDRLMMARKHLNEQDSIKISLNDMLIKALATTMARVPELNVAWSGQTIRQYERTDIAVAVAIPGGLITPVIRDAGSKSLRTISSEVKDLAARAREGRLKPGEFQGGTISISNLGMFGTQAFTPIINPPQSAILAAGAARRAPVIENDNIVIGHTMTLTLAVDHRAIDGAPAARFLDTLKALLEEPLKML